MKYYFPLNSVSGARAALCKKNSHALKKIENEKKNSKLDRICTLITTILIKIPIYFKIDKFTYTQNKSFS